MWRYDLRVVNEARRLRSEGYTYTEIREKLNVGFPKGTLHAWFKGMVLPESYYLKLKKMNKIHLEKVRLIAQERNRIKRKEFFEGLTKINIKIADFIHNEKTAKIALAMLCLGEASKYKSNRAFSLGNTDPRIIIVFLTLLKTCFKFDLEKIRCTVQCRADQNIEDLEDFWQEVTGVPKRLFYKARIDPRTIGKPTLKKDYKGVLKIDYFDSRVQLELESLADLVYNQLKLKHGPEV
ncbi:MAG: hypothetical protein HY344_04005 [Candidatus Levybacteria bacterium]|nr:hypothetical protein [Candidatus Levybacteria bacterium]